MRTARGGRIPNPNDMRQTIGRRSGDDPKMRTITSGTNAAITNPTSIATGVDRQSSALIKEKIGNPLWALCTPLHALRGRTVRCEGEQHVLRSFLDSRVLRILGCSDTSGGVLSTNSLCVSVEILARCGTAYDTDEEAVRAQSVEHPGNVPSRVGSCGQSSKDGDDNSGLEVMSARPSGSRGGPAEERRDGDGCQNHRRSSSPKRQHGRRTSIIPNLRPMRSTAYPMLSIPTTVPANPIELNTEACWVVYSTG